mmetsp:Transcript_8840/g.13194  ORF Transcript_8840/g.13194 Transcript_8840/m.13194 type:complete len:83 (+) Transcript_8840:3837-4085(+)
MVIMIVVVIGRNRLLGRSIIVPCEEYGAAALVMLIFEIPRLRRLLGSIVDDVQTISLVLYLQMIKVVNVMSMVGFDLKKQSI